MKLVLQMVETLNIKLKDCSCCESQPQSEEVADVIVAEAGGGQKVSWVPTAACPLWHSPPDSAQGSSWHAGTVALVSDPASRGPAEMHLRTWATAWQRAQCFCVDPSGGSAGGEGRGGRGGLQGSYSVHTGCREQEKYFGAVLSEHEVKAHIEGKVTSGNACTVPPAQSQVLLGSPQ